MPEAANALHCDEISTAKAGIAKCVVGRDARAKERGCLNGAELVWNRHDAARFSDHHLGIASIDVGPRYHRVLTVHNVPASAGFAHAVFAPEEADTDAFADLPLGDAATDGVDAAHNFMARHPRQLQSWIGAADCSGIGVTDAACLHPNSDLTDPGLRDRPFDDPQLARFGHFNRSVLGSHVRSPTNSVARLTNSSGYWHKAPSPESGYRINCSAGSTFERAVLNTRYPFAVWPSARWRPKPSPAPVTAAVRDFGCVLIDSPPRCGLRSFVGDCVARLLPLFLVTQRRRPIQDRGGRLPTSPNRRRIYRHGATD